MEASFNWSTMRKVLLPLALVVGLMAVMSSSASAGGHKYCNVLLAPLGTCGIHSGTSTEGNVALYQGAGNLTVCESVNDITIGKVISSECGVNGTGGVHNVQGSLGHDMFVNVQNGSSVNAHTVLGNWFSP
jgi:hypothetical protein